MLSVSLIILCSVTALVSGNMVQLRRELLTQHNADAPGRLVNRVAMNCLLRRRDLDSTILEKGPTVPSFGSRTVSPCAVPLSVSRSMASASHTLPFAGKARRFVPRTVHLPAISLHSVDSVMVIRACSSRARGEQDRPEEVAKKPRPNYFLSLRVKSPSIWERVSSLQSILVANEPSLAQCLIAPVTMHITLFVMHLADANAVESAMHVLCTNSVVGSLPPITVDFDGFATFGTRTLFAKTSHQSAGALKALAKLIFDSYTDAELVSGKFDFKAHVTICKTSKARSRHKMRQAPLKIERAMFEEFRNEGLGRYTFEGVELLYMMEKDAEGYYKQLAFLPFAGDDSAAKAWADLAATVLANITSLDKRGKNKQGVKDGRTEKLRQGTRWTRSTMRKRKQVGKKWGKQLEDDHPGRERRY
eukprot:gnl/TRDRNA2_/TRDRNA2_161893_c0_seq1.p1 gnl/TRDRNA2_/TRDRNA2_161893_c0~~gnl/TRDRNA2_/TRDRNA2_161893_c0_seq1.p1  ORF type:complete len:418 (-),score=41.74 gnl/TRDRNA2_/TRDRNA2_161893_c0_seq1:235-1488(-)